MPMDCTNNVSCGAFYLIITGVIARDDVDKTFTIICLNVGPIEEIDRQFFGTGCTKSSIWGSGSGVKVRSEKEADLMMDDNPAQ